MNKHLKRALAVVGTLGAIGAAAAAGKALHTRHTNNQVISYLQNNRSEHAEQAAAWRKANSG